MTAAAWRCFVCAATEQRRCNAESDPGHLVPSPPQPQHLTEPGAWFLMRVLLLRRYGMPSRMGPGAGMPARGSQWRAIVKGLPISASWQDLKVRLGGQGVPRVSG